jgi:hypothetical protein
MDKRTTTVRMPEELAEKAEVIARGRGISVNALMLEALEAEIERVRHDDEFMTPHPGSPRRVRYLTLAEALTIAEAVTGTSAAVLARASRLDQQTPVEVHHRRLTCLHLDIGNSVAGACVIGGGRARFA